MAAAEELLDVEDIQGDSLAGFRKDCQRFLFYGMDRTPAGLAAMRAWLRGLAPHVSSVAEVHAFNQLFRQMRRRRAGRDPGGLTATWLNVAFSAEALRLLTSDAEVEAFTDGHFKSGLARTAALLNDPVDAGGNPIDWKVGGAGDEADVLVIIASDDPAKLEARLGRLEKTIRDAALFHGPAPLRLMLDQPGRALPPPLSGHEHFGFKDGVSQPGVRGLVRSSPAELLTPRLFDPSVAQADVSRPEFSRPGQPLVWPGQFVFGYNRQQTQDPRAPLPVDSLGATAPAWGRNGSYVVVRRLRQDVRAFRAFVASAAAELQLISGFSGMTPDRFAALMVGRWPSGAPIMRAAGADDSALGADDHASNFFQYEADSPPPMMLDASLHYRGDSFPLSRADPTGGQCPLAGHIRKVNPRDGITEQGNASDALTRLVLRRGIPFGDGYDTADPATRDLPEHDRGLIFVSYQTSIDSQFVFLQTKWANNVVDPNNGGGPDPIIGQRREDGRARTFTVVGSNGERHDVTLNAEWVVPTGGGFFFSPSISTIANVLGREHTT
jgi:Dyp-type peroxidase family